MQLFRQVSAGLIERVSDAELLQKLEEVSGARDSLLGQLAPRRKREAEVLARLENERKSAEEDINRHRFQLARDAVALKTAETRRAELQKGLSPYGLAWARVGEPIVICMLILAMAASAWAWPVMLLGGVGFGIGAGAAWVNAIASCARKLETLQHGSFSTESIREITVLRLLETDAAALRLRRAC